MRQQINRELIILIFISALFFFLIGCQGTRLVISSGPPPEREHEYEKEGPPPWAPAHGHRAKYRYYYYPSSRVYHDRARGLYFYYKDSEWKVSVSLPVWLRIDVNESVTLEMDSDRPYKYHDEVEKRYPPGQLKKKSKVKRK